MRTMIMMPWLVYIMPMPERIGMIWVIFLMRKMLFMACFARRIVVCLIVITADIVRMVFKEYTKQTTMSLCCAR